ncbi:MAG: hypothetical protein KA519_02040 [Bacteroides sp.]|uniref:hypothetical protein n=1 Tax=Bacteroides sp. TaxID=29523 RepID=UPI001B6244A4|nr:hypothetical protein [Bacteroides sp.]MBP6066848.1 hypothetical protein [Bacteroides sp.]
MDEFSRLGLHSVIDKSLGLRSSYAGYQYSELISSLFWIYYCGGNHIEVIGKLLGKHLELCPDTEIPSPDTLLRGIKKFAELDIHYTSEKGVSYAFNKVEPLNNLVLDMLLQTENSSQTRFMIWTSTTTLFRQKSMTLSILTRRNMATSLV